MNSNYISSPNDFQHTDGVESINFERTFALDGIGEDETLRLFLRKAGLSDKIENLTPEQRRAFICDIIRSNKMPGYWTPSTMASFSSTTRPTPPALPERRNNSLTGTQSNNNSSLHYASISTCSSNNSLQSLERSSPIVPRRFEPQPPTPPSPSSFVTSLKGSKYEISGPMNFQHISGDMTRDRTRNAFDLSMAANDNVLRKYMMERGITEDDLIGMGKQDIIKNIVQSKFTWMPPRRNGNGTVSHQAPNMMYATITTNDGYTEIGTPKTSHPRKSMHAPPPPPPLPSVLAPSAAPSPSPPPAPVPLQPLTFYQKATPALTASPPPQTTTSMKPTCSLNFLASRFVDPSEFPSIEDIYNTKTELETAQTPMQIRQTFRKPPPPPPVKPKSIIGIPLPPPPSIVKANNNKSSVIYHSNQSLNSIDEPASACEEIDRNIYERPSAGQISVPLAPKLTIVTTIEDNEYETVKPIYSQSDYVRTTNSAFRIFESTGNRKTSVPKTPPKCLAKTQFISNVSTVAPPPPPLPPPASEVEKVPKASLLTPPKPASKPQFIKKVSTPATPPPPPPPSATEVRTVGVSAILYPKPVNITIKTTPPPPPPPPPVIGGNLPPAPPMLNVAAKSGPPVLSSAINGNFDTRDALLDSIRKGITLKKVDQKVATISGVKPRAEHKPPVNDFLSELKLGITLRRVKNKDENPYAGDDPDESQA